MEMPFKTGNPVSILLLHSGNVVHLLPDHSSLKLSLIHIYLLTATLDAARIRLRPILMTSIAFIMGCLPLAVATGAGAAARDVYKRQHHSDAI